MYNVARWVTKDANSNKAPISFFLSTLRLGLKGAKGGLISWICPPNTQMREDYEKGNSVFPKPKLWFSFFNQVSHIECQPLVARGLRPGSPPPTAKRGISLPDTRKYYFKGNFTQSQYTFN